MNINVNAAASIAGTARAAARGGETDAQAAEAMRQQSTAETPAGKSPDSSAIDAGDQTGDRDGHGQQVLDVFERSKRAKDTETPEDGTPEDGTPQDDDASSLGPLGSDEQRGTHLDLQA